MSTPLNSSTQAPPANIMPRVIAIFIDLFVLIVQWGVVVLSFSIVSLVLSAVRRNLALSVPFNIVERVVFWAGWVWTAAVIVLYFPFWWQRDGQTFGMRLMKLRVVTVSGGPLTWWRALLRWMGALLAIGWLWALVDKRNQTWHDKLSGTLVISTEGQSS